LLALYPGKPKAIVAVLRPVNSIDKSSTVFIRANKLV